MLKNIYHLFVKIIQWVIPQSVVMLLLIANLPCQAAIYKWSDQQGQVHYSSQPAPAGYQTTKIIIRHNTTTRPGISKEELDIRAINRRETELKNKKRPPATQQIKKKIPASVRHRLCRQARTNLDIIQSRGRMREINARGEHVYLSEKQRQQRINTVKKRQRKYCR